MLSPNCASGSDPELRPQSVSQQPRVSAGTLELWVWTVQGRAMEFVLQSQMEGALEVLHHMLALA